MGWAAGDPGWWVLGGLAVLAASQPLACGTADDTGEDPIAAAAQGPLAAVGPEVVLPTLEAFQADLDVLTEAISDWAEATAGTGDPVAARQAAQDAWVDAMTTWQQAEVHQIGPAGSSLTVVAGADLRDQIYSWPTVNPCRVDQETVEEDWRQDGYFAGQLVNVMGLDALEVLLFSGPDNACPPQTPPNSDGAWDALTTGEIAALRAGHAEVVVERLHQDTATLYAAWDPADGDFGGTALADPGGPASPYADATEAVNAVFDALYYLETDTKERKLARPLGLGDCLEAACLDGLESPLAGRSHRWIEANLVGFRLLFTGGEGAGLDDLLDDVGHGDLSAQVTEAVDAALAAAAEVEQPLDVAISEDRADVEALYNAVDAVTDLLRDQVSMVLSLEVPSEAAGDND